MQLEGRNMETKQEQIRNPSILALTPHNPIDITSDDNFTDYGFIGNGSETNPYVIEGYNITTIENDAIYIAGTTKYFVVRNCYVDAGNYGILINNVADDTATIINNTCNNNGFTGIKIDLSGGSTVDDNTCNNNLNNGILISYSGSSIVDNNTCNNNSDDGIYLYFSGSSTVTDNTCNDNNNGIHLYYSGSSTVTDNTCNNNSNNGIYIESSGSETLEKNTCNNNWAGIVLADSDLCNITYNHLQTNTNYGIRIYSTCESTSIYSNNFIDNHQMGSYCQAFDDGTDNYWYNTATSKGNYWSDWVSGSYSIDGSASAVDLYPLGAPADIIPPLIVNIIYSPAIPTELDTISINATVTDDSGIYNVTLHYRINSGIWIVDSMTLMSGDIYNIIIGPFVVSDTIEYYVSAVDNSDDKNEAFNDNFGQYYSFTVAIVVPEFLTFSVLLPMIIFLFMTFGLVVLQQRKK